jgi:hypothetical protein
MPGFLDDSEIDLECPSCHHEFQRTLGQLKDSPEITCPGCGGIIEIDFQRSSDLKKAEDALDRFHKTIDDLNRRG